MSQRITIEIKNKIATCLTELPVVCGNADYEVEFTFDEEWNEHEIKTATFVVNGELELKVFSGNVCKMPVLQNTLIARIGVFAGTIDDGTLSTSTPAIVHCKPSATCGNATPAPPKDDVYNQIIKRINEIEVATAPQSDYAQNDSTARDYIKNKPCQFESGWIECENITFTTAFVDFDGVGGYVYISEPKDYDFGKKEPLKIILDGIEYDTTPKNYDGTLYLGNFSKLGTLFGEELPDTGEPFFFISTNDESLFISDTKQETTHTFIIKRFTETYIPLNKNYLGLFNPTEEWTDEEKQKACETIGASDKKYVDLQDSKIRDTVSVVGFELGEMQTTMQFIYDYLLKGKQVALAFEDYATLKDTFYGIHSVNIGDSEFSVIYVGQSVYIKELNVPDLWISNIFEEYETPTLSTNEEILAELQQNGSVRIGIFEFSQLETGKVDLADYVKVEDKDVFVKDGLVNNTEAWTDEEKASACANIGAVSSIVQPNNSPAGDFNALGFAANGPYGKKGFYATYLGGSYTGVLRDSNGVVHGKPPTTDTGLTPKKYVDDLVGDIKSVLEAILGV